MNYTLDFTDKSKKDIQKIKKSGNKALYKKLTILLEELIEHPFTGTGNPEQLKHKLFGYWSRRISKEHRLIYSVNDSVVTVTILSALGHYSDK